MVTIRCADLPDGMHAQAQGSGRQAIIYLAPGLSPGQRTAALRRLIQASRRGHGPRLRRPAVSLAVARFACRVALRNAATAARRHPVGSLAIAALLTAAVVCYAVFVSVTIRLNPRPGPPAAQGAAPVIRESGVPLPGSGPGRGGPSGGPARGPGGSSAAMPSPSRSAPGAGGAPSQLAASPTPLASASGAGPSASARPSSVAPSPPPDPAPSSSSGSPGGVCLTVGPLGVCVSV